MNGAATLSDSCQEEALPNCRQREDCDGIELTHDTATGETSVVNNDSETTVKESNHENDSMSQCAVWSANFSGRGEDSRNIYAESLNSKNFSGGDIWSTEGFSFQSPLKDLLDNNRFSLFDLLAQDELLQELRGCEARLVDYFARPEIVASLVECLVCEVPYTNEERGKERWCMEENDRRKSLREQRDIRAVLHTLSKRERESHGGDDCSPWPQQYNPTVLATTDETGDEPHIEAKWNSPIKSSAFSPEKDGVSEREERSPEEEYDLRYVRYPYMACEVLCSEVGITIDVLVDGYVQDIIDDDEDSLLNGNSGHDEINEIKIKEKEEFYDNINLFLDGDNNDESFYHSVNSNKLSPHDLQLESLQKQHQSPSVQGTPTPPKRILDLLFAVLIDTPPFSLDDRRAGYFEKILTLLFQKRSQAMSDYMNTPIIVTAKSVGIAQQMFSKAQIKRDGKESESNHLIEENLSLYSSNTSWSPLVNSSGNVKELLGNHSSLLQPNPSLSYSSHEKVINCVSSYAPPILMCVLLDQLHSHSMMYIVQRLLLPSAKRHRQSLKEKKNGINVLESSNNDRAGKLDTTDRDKYDTQNGKINSAINNRFTNVINQLNNVESPNIFSKSEDEDEELGDDGIDDSLSAIFQCDWSEKPDHALNLLLLRLRGSTEPFLLKYGFPVGYHFSKWNRDNSKIPYSDIEQDVAKFSCSQNSSEILISIIQNSSLNSPITISLSSDPMLRSILDIMTISGIVDQPVFAPHESTMTFAMSVLESLILQLGGYGASAASASAGENGLVTTASDAREKLPPNPMSMNMMDASFNLTEIGPHTPPALSPITNALSPTTATATSLIRHLPRLLGELSLILVHPVTENWMFPVQYTRERHRQMLGTSRLRILRLIESLVLLGNPMVDFALKQSDCLECCLDLFWEFELCSMLHQSVANFLVHVFEGGDKRATLQEYFIMKCRLLEKLMESFVANGNSPSEYKLSNRGTIIDAKDSKSFNEEKEMDYFPRLGDMMIDLKTKFSLDPLSPSLECEHRNEAESNNDGINYDEDGSAVVPVSEDDVDSAMAIKEEQDNEIKIGVSHKDSDIIEGLVEPLVRMPDSEEVLSRKGYMGHVIIICQSLVNACSDTEKVANQCETSTNLNEIKFSSNVTALNEFSLADIADDDSNNVTVATNDDVAHSKWQKDREPVRGYEEDTMQLCYLSKGDNSISNSTTNELFSPTSPISKLPSSPTEVESISHSSLYGQLKHDIEKPLRLELILRQHPLYDKWQCFVTTTLAYEVSVQSKPLGGQSTTKDSNTNAFITSLSQTPTVIDDDSDSDFLGSPVDHKVFSENAVGEIDMDENDLDIAASMMEALSLPQSNAKNLAVEHGLSSTGHNRSRPVIGGGILFGGQEKTERGKGIGNFGSVLQRPDALRSTEYIYDDPLGRVNPFESDDSSDNDERESMTKAFDDGFMSDVMVILKEENVNRTNGILKISSSTDSDDATGEDDDDVPPVMDLFAGNFSFDESITQSSPLQGSSGDDIGWANFANFDEAFAQSENITP